ncbi:MAG TPA: MotA/TolQ/ExbB proton channel family protein, partial [Isosphaeraceae bacterium]|nr:MotA/TolQ/ExbB proton channel family protein [Isosphaeraceae bacterium]
MAPANHRSRIGFRKRNEIAIKVVALTLLVVAAGADGPPPWRAAARAAEAFAQRARDWFARTGSLERIGWGGLAACAGLGAAISLSGLGRLQRRKVLPPVFVERFLGRLREGKLDRQKATDLCELNPAPAARLALAAIERWGRPTMELERGMVLARRAEAARLGRGFGTLRRVAELAPLLGLLGTLGAAQRVLAASAGWPRGMPPGHAWADVLEPVTAGVVLAVLGLVAYDGLMVKLEGLLAALSGFEADLADALSQQAAPPASARPGQGHGQPLGPHR